MRTCYTRWHEDDLRWELGYGGDERMSTPRAEWLSYAKGTIVRIHVRWNRAHINKCRRHKKGLMK